VVSCECVLQQFVLIDVFGRCAFYQVIQVKVKFESSCRANALFLICIALSITIQPKLLDLIAPIGTSTKGTRVPLNQKSTSMRHTSRLLALLLLALTTIARAQPNIPLPEHPRPDFQRPEWQNLNGDWAFELDAKDVGVQQKWFNGQQKFSRTIHVPFPWGSPLSGVPDSADIAWYQRTINVPSAWKGKHTFITIGASDWRTTVYLDGKELGSHDGGYTPFSFDLTDQLTYGLPQQLVIRVDDVRRPFTLYGKQGYGNARGIWQTVYLENRGNTYLEAVRFAPDIDAGKVKVSAFFPAPALAKYQFAIEYRRQRTIHIGFKNRS
jgi:hypothetical protein